MTLLLADPFTSFRRWFAPSLSPGRAAVLTLALLAGSAPLAVAEAPPTLFVLGDSTAHNSGPGRNHQPMVGWGTPLAAYFDPAKLQIANVAHAGQSSRTYFNRPEDWPRVLPQIRPHDFVLLVFGINDGGPPTSVASRGSIPGLGEETVALSRPDGSVETAHTYGWYMSAMADGARDHGAQVYLLTVTVRNIWHNPKVKFRDGTPVGPLPADYNPADDHIERGTANGKYTAWTIELGSRLHLPVLDLTNLCADRYESLGRTVVNTYYSDHNHTYAAGADLVASLVVAGLKAFPGSPFAPFLSARGQAVPAADPKYIRVNPTPSGT